MKLADWLSKYPGKRAELISLLKITPPALYGWCAGRFTPTPKHIEKIEEFTGRAVTLGDFVRQAEEKRPRRKAAAR